MTTFRMAISTARESLGSGRVDILTSLDYNVRTAACAAGGVVKLGAPVRTARAVATTGTEGYPG